MDTLYNREHSSILYLEKAQEFGILAELAIAYTYTYIQRNSPFTMLVWRSLRLDPIMPTINPPI